MALDLVIDISSYVKLATWAVMGLGDTWGARAWSWQWVLPPDVCPGHRTRLALPRPCRQPREGRDNASLTFAF